MVSAQDILNPKFETIDANEPFSKILPLFKDVDAIIVTDHDKYEGMLLKRTLILMEPNISLHTKTHTILTHTPKLAPTLPLEEIARIMIENHIYHLPVLSNETILGIVTADELIKKLTEQNIGSQPIKTIMCTQPLTIKPEETIGTALHLFQHQDVSYLAVVEHNNLVGAITLDDIIELVMHPHIKNENRIDFSSEKRKKLDLSVKTIMQEQPLLLSPETAIRDVHIRMHRFELPGIFIGTENHLHGIVTHKELLAPYAGTQKQETIAIQFHHNTNTVEGFDKEQTIHFLRTEFLKNYEKFLEFGYLHISLEQHKETKHRVHRIVCEMKLSSQQGVFYATHEGYGPMQTIKNATEAIAHQINKKKSN
jgi:CBS domain-containing protein